MNTSPMPIKEVLEITGYQFTQKPQFGLIVAPDKSRVAVTDFSDETLIQLINDRTNMPDADFCDKYVLDLK